MTAPGPLDAALCALLGLDVGRVAALVDRFAARGSTVATAESLTAGLVAAVLTEIPGSSAVVRGGIVCYATDLKASLLGVDAALLARTGPVDPDVARQLAAGARRCCAASVGVGLTGVAGPAEQGGHAPGTVYIAVADADGDEVSALPGDGEPRSRWAVRSAAVRQAIVMLERLAAR